MRCIVVIGLGSMGKRRIRLLRSIDENLTIYGVDSNAERCQQIYDEYHIETYSTLKKAVYGSKQRPEAAVISTSPLSHAAIIEECLDENLHIFTELNLVNDRYEENIRKAKLKGKVLFLSSTFLYREEIQYIQNKVKKCKSPINYTYHIGQYLPDWHPWESYKNFFVGEKRTNGCREIFAIELPWLQKTFGRITSYQVIKGKCTNLNIDYPDTYHLLLEHENGSMGSLQVDVVSRKAVRNLELYSEDMYLTWNGSPTGLNYYDFEKKEEQNVLLYEEVQHMEGYSSFIIENAYQNELQAYLKEISGRNASRYSFEDDLVTLKLIDEIEGLT